MPCLKDIIIFLKRDITLIVYIDNLLIFSPNIKAINRVKKQLLDKYKIKNLKLISFFIRIKIE
jgi:hypothetical protein